MVIGHLYLMPQHDTKKYHPNDSSILILKDKFYFYIQDKSYFYSITDFSKLNSEEFHTWIKEKQLVIKNPLITHFEGVSNIIPLEMFNEKSAPFYLSKATTLKDYQEISFNILEQSNHVVVYSINKGYYVFLKELFPNLKSQHYSTHLLTLLIDSLKNNYKKKVFIHTYLGAFDIFLFRGKQLLFFNSFPQQNVDEFLYYLFYVTEQFYLKPDMFDIVFLGEYDCFKQYYKGVKEYHPSITFLDTPVKNTFSRHPIPFFENKIP